MADSLSNEMLGNPCLGKTETAHSWDGTQDFPLNSPISIPAFLKAQTPEQLQELMLQNNINKKAYHEYTIIYTGSNWYAWYDVPLDDVIRDKFNDKRQRSRVK